MFWGERQFWMMGIITTVFVLLLLSINPQLYQKRGVSYLGPSGFSSKL
jgi:hypothetical protein